MRLAAYQEPEIFRNSYMESWRGQLEVKDQNGQAAFTRVLQIEVSETSTLSRDCLQRSCFDFAKDSDSLTLAVLFQANLFPAKVGNKPGSKADRGVEEQV